MSSLASIERQLRAIESGDYFRRLCNHPSPHARRRTPELLCHRTVGSRLPAFTVVTPAFNCAEGFADYVEATLASATLPFDWIVIDDASDDGTAELVRAAFERLAHPLVARATLLRNPVPIYETACDNLGFTLAETDLIVEVQSDIQVREPGFDALFLHAFQLTPRPASLSGRCGHSFFGLRRKWLRRLLGGSAAECVGLCGAAIETPEVIEPLKGRLFRCETVPRGPWAVSKADLERHGYLDERYFFLGNDDHDYHRRVTAAEGRRPVYVPMTIHSPLRLGATRRARSGVNQEVFTMLKRERRGSPAFRRFIATRLSPSLPDPFVAGFLHRMESA